MRFDLTEQQLTFQQSVADYLTEQCPRARALLPHNHPADADLQIWRGLMELGIGGLVVPESYGGLGQGLLDLAVVTEAIGRAAAPGPFIEHSLATLAIALGGSDEQKARWLPALASGEKLATVAIAEPGGAWLADQWQCHGERAVTGKKEFVLHARQADLLVVGAADGRMALVVPEASGVDLQPVPATDAGKQMAHVTFSETPCDFLAAPVGRAVVDAGLILLAADAFGGAAQCVSMAVEYSKERHQFGQPIGAFQAVKHQLADMALTVEPSVGLYWYAAHRFDTDPEHCSDAAAQAKAHITELYPRIARRMIEAHGGIGYTWEYGAHVWLKRALFNQAYLGMPRVHRARVAEFAGW